MTSARKVIRQILVEQPEPYPLAGHEVGGLTVGKDVPNTDSISASLENYEVLQGIREVPLSVFDDPAAPYSPQERKRVGDLAYEIQVNGWIAPLIVVIDADGPYILEGGHRLEALYALGVESLPAMVVMDQG